jgi:hypothetical protein
MKFFVLTAFILIASAVAPAQEKTITEKEFNDAWKAGYSKALQVVQNSSNRNRREGRKGIEGNPASLSHAVHVRETVVGPGRLIRDTIDLTENGSATKTITMLRPKAGTNGWEYVSYDAATKQWKPAGRTRSPMEGFKYVTVPGEKSGSEMVFSKSDVFKFAGTVQVNGKKAQVYTHKHVRDFTLEGGVGSYYTDIKYTFAEDGSYFKSESSTTRIVGKEKGFASASDEWEHMPGLKIAFPVVSAQASTPK